MTLIEVLAATVLLAIMASTVAPLLSESLAILHEKPLEIDVFEVGLLADTFLEDPEAFGVENLDEIIDTGSFELPWPQEMHINRAAIQVSVLRPEMTAEQVENEHVWLLFISENVATMRWHRIEPDSESGGGEGITP